MLGVAGASYRLEKHLCQFSDALGTKHSARSCHGCSNASGLTRFRAHVFPCREEGTLRPIDSRRQKSSESCGREESDRGRGKIKGISKKNDLTVGLEEEISLRG